MSETKTSKKPILLFDSECTLCSRFKKALEAIDTENKIRFVSIHNQEIYTELPFLDKVACNDTVHLVDENNNVYKGPEVVKYLAGHFPGVSKFAWLLETNIGDKTLNIFYDFVNDYRKRSDCKACKK